MFFVAFLIVYSILLVTSFYHNPFIAEGDGRIFEIIVLLYVSGIALEDVLQVGSLAYFVIYLQSREMHTRVVVYNRPTFNSFLSRSD